MRGVRTNRESGTIVGLVVEELPSLLAVGTVNLARVAARIIIGQGAIRLSHPNRDTVAKVADDFRTALQLAVEQPIENTTTLTFGDVVLEALRNRPGPAMNWLWKRSSATTPHATSRKPGSHKPLKALTNNTPLDAVGSKVLRKHVFGVVKFLEDCLQAVLPHKQIGEQMVPITLYDFASLRHKLNLEYVAAAPPNGECVRLSENDARTSGR